MRIKKVYVLYVFTCVGAFAFVTLLLGKSSNSYNNEQETLSLEKKVKELEKDLKQSHRMVQKNREVGC